MDKLKVAYILYACSNVVFSLYVKIPDSRNDINKNNAKMITINYSYKMIAANSIDGVKAFHDGESFTIAPERGFKKPDVRNRSGMTSKELDYIKTCAFSVSAESTKTFQGRVLKDGAIALILNLKFSHDIKISGSPEIILPFKWIWVLKDTHTCLQMPYAAKVWSLGLLNLHDSRQVTVELSYKQKRNVHENCYNMSWVIGNRVTDTMIGNAVGEMIKRVAPNGTQFKTSHWCYMRKIPLTGEEVYPLFDDNFFSTSPSLEYSCCKYRSASGKPYPGVVCAKEHKYDPVWWDVPLGLGILMLLYFSLIFLKVSGMVHEKILETSVRNDDVANSDAQTQENVVSKRKRNDIIYLKGKAPITAMSVIGSVFSPLRSLKRSTKSRLAIFVYSFVTLLVPGIELMTYFFFLHEYFIDLARNNITVGFSAVLIGWDANKMKLSLFGGPYVALGVYLIIGWIVTLVPECVADQLYYGVTEGSDNSRSVLTISLVQKEILGSVKIRKYRNGYIRLFKLQICRIYMLINPSFWIVALNIMKDRWMHFLSNLNSCISVNIIVYGIEFICFPFYIVISILELFVSTILFAFPLFSFIVCIVRGYTIGLNKYISEKFCLTCSKTGALLRLPLGMFVLVLLIYYLYIFTVLFFDGFFFLSRVLMFTYTAVVAYPRETYGYFMLVIISAVFGLEGFFHFGDIYHLTLQITVKLCKHNENLQAYLCQCKGSGDAEVYGVSKDMFEYLVERIRPRRIQALYSVLKFASMVFILTISIILMERFRKFEDLSLLVHVFIVLFVCALPAIYKFVIPKEDEKVKLKKKIKKHLRRWITEKQEDEMG